jgi:peptidoglycan/xylan/chitin deacetylase (PgdA/CDA1 family)
MFVWDDGWKSVYTKAAPILKQFGYTGVVGVITDLATKPNWRYMNWTEIRALRNIYRWSIASHTTEHCSLAGELAGNYSNCPIQESAAESLLNSRQKIVSETGVIPISFVHPGNAWTPETMDVCAKYYSLCFGPAYPTSSPHFISKNTGWHGS